MNNKDFWTYSPPRIGLAEFDENWTGWTIIGPELVSPENWRFRPTRILASIIDRQQIQALRAELRKAREMRPAYSPRLTQWHTLRAAMKALEYDIRQGGTDDELEELRELTQHTRKV